MLQKKICLLGAFSVGKTSLVKRYVESFFGEKYITTVGVQISKKKLIVDDQEVTLMIWDLAGEDDFTLLRTSYLRGTSGYIVVADGTRSFSLATALGMYKEAKAYSGDLPFIVIINKADLMAVDDGANWQLDQKQIAELEESGAQVVYTSAKTGSGVDKMFHTLTNKMLAEHQVLANT